MNWKEEMIHRINPLKIVLPFINLNPKLKSWASTPLKDINESKTEEEVIISKSNR